MSVWGKIFLFAGLALLGIGFKWAASWALIGGFVALLLVCAAPIARFFFAPNR